MTETGSLIEKLEAMEIPRDFTPRARAGYLLGKEAAIDIVRQHEATQRNQIATDQASDSKRPSDIPAVDMNKLIKDAVTAGNTEYWRSSNEHDAALREWKLGGFRGERPSMQQTNNVSMIDCISASVKQNLLPYLRTPVATPQGEPWCIEHYPNKCKCNEQPVGVSAIEKALDEYETECIRYGQKGYSSTDALQAARKRVVAVTTPHMRESSDVAELDRLFCEAYSNATTSWDASVAVDQMHDAFAELLRLYRGFGNHVQKKEIRPH